MPPDVTKAANLRPNPNPIDPDVKIPAAVIRAREAAEAAQLAAYPDQVAEPPAPPAPSNNDGIVIAPPAPTPPPSTPSVTPKGNETTPPPSPPSPPTPPTPPVDDNSWEHKYNSERGRRQKLEEQIRAQGERMLAMENLLQDMQLQSTAPPTPPPPTPEQLITEQERNEFGPEMIDVMGRRAREIVSPELAELRASMKSLEQKITGTQTAVKRNTRADMFSSLDRDMPTWRHVNELPEFKTWLALPDPYSGAIRHRLLLSAFEQDDTPRVLNFFKGFVSELAASTPAGDTGQEPPAPPAPAKPSLENLAAPGRARTPAQVNLPAEKPIITTADVSAFYAAVRRGAYVGREAEKAALEQELFQAQSEGRVRAV